MHVKAEFFHRNSYLGQGLLKLGFVKAETEQPLSRAYFCPKCGEVWARVVVEGATEFRVYTAMCEKHEYRWFSEIPGSLWLSWDRDFQDSIPLRAALREAELHLAHAEWAHRRSQC